MFLPVLAWLGCAVAINLLFTILPVFFCAVDTSPMDVPPIVGAGDFNVSPVVTGFGALLFVALTGVAVGTAVTTASSPVESASPEPLPLANGGIFTAEACWPGAAIRNSALRKFV